MKFANDYDTSSKQIIESIRSLFQELRLSSAAAEKACGLSTAQLFVLENLRGKPPMTLNELANLTLTHQSSVSVVVEKLKQKRLLIKSVDRNDRRRSLISLTPKGMITIRKRKSSFHEQLLNGIEQFSQTERRTLAKLLRKLLIQSSFSELKPSLFFEESPKRRIA